MLRSKNKTTVPAWPLAMLAAAVMVSGLARDAVADPDPSTEVSAETEPVLPADPAPQKSLTGLGLDLEAARLKAEMGDMSSVEAVSRALDNMDGDLIPDGSDAAVALLWGEIHYEQGSFEKAASAFDKARGKTSDPGFKATAEFQRIESLEAEGRDEEAAKLWLKWISDNQDHAGHRVPAWNFLPDQEGHDGGHRQVGIVERRDQAGIGDLVGA